MLVTDDFITYEKAIASAHYERFDDRIITPEINLSKGFPL